MTEAVAGGTPEAALRRSPLERLRDVVANPWGRPRFLGVFTWLYLTWAIVPLLIAIQFSFNAGRSRAVWQGFSTRWYWGDPELSVWHNPALRAALEQSLRLAVLDMAIATPLGVALAIGLVRWRGRGSRPANVLMLFPLVTPEIVLGVALLLVFLNLFTVIDLGTTAQVIGQVTLSLSFVVIIVRGRLLSIGREYEEAAMDLGSSPLNALRLALLPLLAPAIFASLMVVFAISLDDFVVTQYLSSDAGSQTIPINVYNNARGTPNPSLNALASVMVFFTVAAITLAYIVYRVLTRHERRARKGQMRDLAAFEI